MITPMIRGNICLNCHPKGCAAVLHEQIGLVGRAKEGAAVQPGAGPRLVLVIGCSTGYGLASRVVGAFGYGAATVGVSLEKAATATKLGTPGWYNNRCFDLEAAAAGIPALTLDGDAFSDKTKGEVAAAIRELAASAELPGQADLVVYSLASPVRQDPVDGILYKSVIKPIGQRCEGVTVDMLTARLAPTSLEPASAEEIAGTVKVMGGEDWERWISALDGEGVLAPDARTVAYTYIGPEHTWAIYKNGTIGKAKEDLERAAAAITSGFAQGAAPQRRAWVSVNKALVTRSSAVIPIIPLYLSCLFKVMKDKGLHEGCIEQMIRLYAHRLYTPEGAVDPRAVETDEAERIRLDDWEMREDVQRETKELMDRITEDNLFALSDFAGFTHDFLESHGFDVPGIDYSAECNPLDYDNSNVLSPKA